MTDIVEKQPSSRSPPQTSKDKPGEDNMENQPDLDGSLVTVQATIFTDKR